MGTIVGTVNTLRTEKQKEAYRKQAAAETALHGEQAKKLKGKVYIPTIQAVPIGVFNSYDAALKGLNYVLQAGSIKEVYITNVVWKRRLNGWEIFTKGTSGGYVGMIWQRDILD